MYACRFMNEDELRQLKSGAVVRDHDGISRYWSAKNRSGEAGDYCFFALNSRRQVAHNVGLIKNLWDIDLDLKGRVLVLVKFTGKRTQIRETAYGGYSISDGDCGYCGSETSFEFSAKEYSKDTVQILAVKRWKTQRDACFFIFKMMKQLRVLPERETFSSLIRWGEKRQKDNFKYRSYYED